MVVGVFQYVWARGAASIKSRPFEWMFAAVTFGWGISLGSPIETFKLNPSYRVFGNLMREETWALLCFYGGLGRLIVLWINGSWFRTPMLRACASLSTLALWLAATIALNLAGTSSTGIYTYAIFFVAEFRCMLNAGYEAGRSERAEWARMHNPAALASYGRGSLAFLFAIGWTRGAYLNGPAGTP